MTSLNTGCLNIPIIHIGKQVLQMYSHIAVMSYE